MKKLKTKVSVFILLLTSLTLFANFTTVKDKNNVVTVVKDMSTINAVLMHPNGKAYFFIRNKYRRYNIQTKKHEKIGVIGKDGWKGVPKNIDAAFIHPHNKKAYFFSGNSYYRFDFNKKRIDKIGVIGVDGWKGLNGPVDAVIAHPTNNSVYFFKGKKYHRYSFSEKRVDYIGTIGVDGWKGVPANISAALIHSNGKAYFFKDDNYFSYDFVQRKKDGKGVIGRNAWRGLYPRLDAVVYNIEHDNLHTFKGKRMVSIHHDVYDANEENNYNFLISWMGVYSKDRQIKYSYHSYRIGYNSYSGVPPNLDASFRRASNKRYYFFKGNKYYRWNPKTKKVDKIANIVDGFKGVPTNIDAATDVSGGAYFFKGTKYYHFNFKEKKVIKSGAISSKFKGMPNYPDAAASLYKVKDAFASGPTGSGTSDDIIFYKNNISYYRLKNKKIKWKTINGYLWLKFI